MRQKTKDEMIEHFKMIKTGRVTCSFSGEELDLYIKELEAIEVEPEPYFKEGEELLFCDDFDLHKIIAKFSGMDGELFCPHQRRGFENAHRFTEWYPFEGEPLDAPDNAKGWHVRFSSGQIGSYQMDAVFKKGIVAEDTIIEYAIWY